MPDIEHGNAHGNAHGGGQGSGSRHGYRHGRAASPRFAPDAAAEDGFLPGRTIVLVGLMGAGKTSIGKRLAKRFGIPFVDADAEIEAAANMTVAEIFAVHGEAAFREGERRVISRLLHGPVQILATGGGAFMDPLTRARIAEAGLSVWLKAEIDVLVARVARRTHRPLLNKGNPRQILSDLAAIRHPIYAEADLTVESLAGPPEDTVERVIEALRASDKALLLPPPPAGELPVPDFLDPASQSSASPSPVLSSPVSPPKTS